MPAWTYEVDTVPVPTQEAVLRRVKIELWWPPEEADQHYLTMFLNNETLDFESPEALENWVTALLALTMRETRAAPGAVAVINPGNGGSRTESLSGPTSSGSSPETGPS